MIEKVYTYSSGNELKIEKLVFDENINYIHLILPKGEGLPDHNANSNLYITVLRGYLSIILGTQEEHIYPQGTIVTFPQGTRMKITNHHEETLELIIVKAPAPMK